MLTVGGSLIGATGLVALAASRSVTLSSLAVVLMGAGFALPYAVMIDAAERLFSGQAAATLALLQTGPNVVPMVVIPLVGSALGNGNAPWASSYWRPSWQPLAFRICVSRERMGQDRTHTSPAVRPVGNIRAELRHRRGP
jgi:hypothetical protein